MQSAEPPTDTGPGPIARIGRPVVTIVLLGFAVHVLLPQVGEIRQGLEALRTGRWPFLLLAVLGTGLSYVAGAWMVRSSVDRPPPWTRTLEVQVAAGAASVLTPMGVGWVAVNEGFLRRQGVDHGTARAATALNMALTVISHVGLLLLTLPLLPTLTLPTISPPQRRVFVDVAVGLAVLLGVALWIPWTRRRVIDVVRPALEAVPAVLGDPARSLRMVAGAVATNLAYALALYGSVAAFGDAPVPLAIVVVYLLAATVAAIAPTPGGLGAMETALVAALTRAAVPGGQAVAGTLAFRLASFWLPLAIGAGVLRIARRREWI